MRAIDAVVAVLPYSVARLWSKYLENLCRLLARRSAAVKVSACGGILLFSIIPDPGDCLLPPSAQSLQRYDFNLVVALHMMAIQPSEAMHRNARILDFGENFHSHETS